MLFCTYVAADDMSTQRSVVVNRPTIKYISALKCRLNDFILDTTVRIKSPIDAKMEERERLAF